jgi:hypothetical protein
MMPKASIIAAMMIGGLPLAVVAGALVLWNHSPRASSDVSGEPDALAAPMQSVDERDTEPLADPEPAPLAPKPVPTLSLVRASTEITAAERGAPELVDEASLLSTLHDLAAADPPRSLRLARQAVNRFPDSANAPEFQWNVVKALFNQGRLDEAKNEARAMLGKYPNSSFTGDVIHHLLSPPPNPAEL